MSIEPVIQRSRAGGASCTVSQSTSTGPHAVIMVLLAFGSPWVMTQVPRSALRVVATASWRSNATRMGSW